MALRMHILFPNSLLQSSKFQSNPSRPTTQILCSNNNNNNNNNNNKSSSSMSDSELASDLAKINTHLLREEEAMKKSKELLFSELCQFLELKEEQVKKKWTKIDEDERWGLVRGFVNEWGVNFHPLSARSVKQMIEEYLREEEEEEQPSSSSASLVFSALKRLLS